MSKKNWKKLADEKPVEPKEPSREELVKALTKIKRRRPMIRSSHKGGGEKNAIHMLCLSDSPRRRAARQAE